MQFAVLPDCPDAAQLVGALPGARRVDHASGNPWLIGDWSDAEFVSVTAGSRRLAILGRTRLDEAAAERSLDRMASPHDLDSLASTLPGAVHLCASVPGVSRVQGSVSGARQVFFTEVRGVTVAASGPAVLNGLIGDELDEALLAARLLSPGGPPWPLSERPLRKGIGRLRTGHWLSLDSAGRGVEVPWWRAPAGTLPLPDAAAAVGAALSEAVALRVDGTVSADLSGGLDSTVLCFLAAAAGADLVTYHAQPSDPANEDTSWARRAQALLPSAQHVTLPARRPESLFDVGYAAPGVEPDPMGPATWAAGLPHVKDLTARVAAAGSGRHLIGIGGDELFGLLPAYPWSYARAHPLRALRMVNRYRLANRWAFWPTLRALADRSTFARNLDAVARRIGDPAPVLTELDFGWVPTPRMPPWATGHAVELVRNLLRDAARSGRPALDPDRTRHQVLASLVFEGATIQQINAITVQSGVSWEAPFLDDRVIEAALSVRIGDRMVSGRYKALLADAVRDTVPAPLLGRRDKGEFSAEVYQGLRENRGRLLELCEESRLGELGLIDPAALRAALLNPGPMSQSLQPFESTIACEGWLRAHHSSTAGSRGGHA